MIDTILSVVKPTAYLAPFILLALLNMKANLKKEYRSCQFLMPVITLVYCIVLMVFLNRISEWLIEWINNIPTLIITFANRFFPSLSEQGNAANNYLQAFSAMLQEWLDEINPVFLLLFAANTIFLLAHIIAKRILVGFMKLFLKNGGKVHDFCVEPFYEKDEDTGIRHVRDHFGQARTFLKTAYLATLVISVAAVLVSCELYRQKLLAVPFYPVFGLLILGEVYFFLDGFTKQEMEENLTGEADDASGLSNYALLRHILLKLFGDKLGADSTSVNSSLINPASHDGFLHELETSDDVKIEAYGRFMRIRSESGLEIDHNYLASGLELLQGNSVLFNNPFYYDLIPYIFYPMNRAMLRHKKVLIVLGWHDIEGDVETWCRDGLTAVTNISSMWNIGVLSSEPQELDVGIVTRSSVHDLDLHEANDEFFRDVEFVVIIEPSKLVTTAQIGLNSIVRHCRRDGKQITFCSTDKNCDGLVDALSHILLTSLTEVSATNHHQGTSSYMCWETDGEHLQHRLLPNLSRYLGMGTELSFAALKNQVSETEWYGGEVFPVVDIHWIAKQYYYDLLHYANLPVSQESMDTYFKVSPNLWNTKVRKNHYLTVEDEACNMFEIKRAFATRAKEQGFINIISPEYLLKDYMMANNDLFNADPKAIPYIVADYAPTLRNVILRLCLRMSAGPVSERDIRQELMLADVDITDLFTSLWHEICMCCRGVGKRAKDKDGREILVVSHQDSTVTFTPDTLRIKRKFSLDTGKMENQYFITDEKFTSLLLGDLQNAGYIAEDEKGDKQYLGTELRGHVFQKYLPGQFFTFGGKYYEMLRVTRSGKVLVRRAADHITGRPSYRQQRSYHLTNVVDSPTMGDKLDIAGLHIIKQHADIRVETPAYWIMDKYNDFSTSKKVTVNAVPERIYHSKQVLRIELPNIDGRLTGEVRNTITVLFNEMFRTLFAENHAYIAAVIPGEAAEPSTYSLFSRDGSASGENCIYIIEDSQLDLGLLVAVQRNLSRIFATVCDYLDWHQETLEESLNPAPAPEVPDFTVEPTGEEEPKTFIGRAIKKIKKFFGKLFKRKKKKAEEEPEVPAAPETPEAPQGDAAEPAAAPAAEGNAVPAAEADPAQVEAPPVEESPDKGDAETVTGAEGEAAPQPDNSVEEAIKKALDEKSDAEEESHQSMTLMNAGALAETQEGKDTISFEPEHAQRPGLVMERKPYHQRYYLLFGGDRLPDQINVVSTLAYLTALGFANSSLTQARKGKDTADTIGKGGVSGTAGKQYCDFCGVELVGTEFEVLSDGRQRCMMCSKTAVRTEEEFCQIYKTVKRNLETFFGAKITVPVRVEMVNSKKLHKRLGKTFIPTGSFDGRTLGVAIKSRGTYSILVENGSPRMQSTMTIAHELIHIWQYLNWDRDAIVRTYGKAQELEIYEGMAKWGEIQYAYFIGESSIAKREEIVTRLRQDPYGFGFVKYAARYPLSTEFDLKDDTPFTNLERPL